MQAAIPLSVRFASVADPAYRTISAQVNANSIPMGHRNPGLKPHYRALLLAAGLVVLAGVIVVVTLLSALNLLFEWSHDEVARVPSPSGGAEAVLVESNGGATTSFGYEVYLVRAGEQYRKGKEVASLYGAVRNASAYGADLRWTSSNRLVIEYWSAGDATILRRKSILGGRAITTELRSGVYNAKAPTGGMLYNRELLEKRRHR
jgi:hypothetical protein